MLKLEDHRYDAVSCPRCSNCKWIDHVYVRSYRFAKICPISTRYNFNAYSAHGLLDLALALLDGRLNYTPRLLDAVYKCTLCGACDVRCKRNLDLEVLLTLEALRNRCIIDGQGPPAGHRVIIKHVGDTGNRYGAPREKRIEWLPERSRLTKKAKILYFVGCNHSYVQKESAKAVAGILKGTGSSFTLLGTEEWCCGRPLIAAGQWGSARELVQHNLETVGRTSINTVVTGCAGIPSLSTTCSMAGTSTR